MIAIETGPAVAEGSGDLLVVPVLSGPVWGPGADWVAERLGGWIDGYLAAADFTGKTGQVATLPGGEAVPYARVAFVGLGDEVDAEGLRRAAGTAGRMSGRAATVVTTLHQVDLEGAAELVALGFHLGAYRFDRYRSEPKERLLERLVLAGGTDADLEAAGRGAVVAEGVMWARDLVNEPPKGKAPADFARAVEEAVADLDVTVRIYDEADIAAERLNGLAGVAAGSAAPPRLVELRYEPPGASASLAFVGKGIVFDSGGLSLKPPQAMETMKTDMSGAAAVFAAVKAIARLGLAVNVRAFCPLTENMPGGRAQRPGDVLTIRNGKTIEVLNTDAEGRLVLADGLCLAAESAPDLIVDLATLTGACKVALGESIAGLFASDDETAARVEGAATRAGERVWRMPLPADYRKLIDSDVADMKNTGGREGGSITAALLLQEFVGEVPWAHLDIAGPARAGSDDAYVVKGGTGFGVRTLVALAEDAGAG
jgi:leucyl aminopeptidase